MSTGAFEQGRCIEISGKSFQLMQKVSDSLWQLQDMRTHRISEMTDLDLRRKYFQGNLCFIDYSLKNINANPNPGISYRDISESAWDCAKMRRAYVMAIIDQPSTKAAVQPTIDQLWLSLKSPVKAPDASSVLRWKKKFLAADRNINVLLDNTVKKGNRTTRYPNDVLSFVETAIETAYMSRERKTVQDVTDKAAALIIEENKLRLESQHLPMPKRRLVQRLVSNVPSYERHVARYGATAATRKFRAALSHRTTEAPLQRAEIDHTQLDLFVIDDKSGLPLGRPWVTACIDDYSRCILGLTIGFEPPSYLTVASCLRSAFMPKLDLHDSYPEIKNEWSAHGIMRELVVDNGLEFHSKSLENVCLQLGIEMHYSARKTPWFKGKIERFFGTFNRAIAHGTPGTSFGNIFEKDDYDPSKHAVIRLGVLQELARKWIVDVYHQKPHATLQATPNEVWKNSIADEDIRLPSNPALLNTILGHSHSRKLTHKGIELDGLLYNSPELTNLRRELGSKLDVDVRSDDADLGYIMVFSPDQKRVFKARALAFQYANGISRWQHKTIKAYAAKTLLSADMTGWLTAKEAVAQMATAEAANKKARTRARVARYRQGSKAPTDVESEEVNTAQNQVQIPDTALSANKGKEVEQVIFTAQGKTKQSTPAKRLSFVPVIKERSKESAFDKGDNEDE